MKYQSNFALSAGCDFSRNFYVTNPDTSPVDLTGATVIGYLAKHPKAIYVTDSTSDHIFYNYIPFDCIIEDGVNGVFSLNLTKQETILLEEGKYSYSVSIIDVNGTNIGEVFSGIIFVDWGMNPEFGTIGPQVDN